MLSISVILFALVASTTCDVSHLHLSEEEHSTPHPPPRPYAFAYTAGRFHGHADRHHAEVSDGSGVVRGTFSYVDPSQKIHRVDYTADKHGFHPVLSDVPPEHPADSEAVAHAKERHQLLYERIAAEHQAQPHPHEGSVPRQTKAVAAAAAKHASLFRVIAEQHARIAAEREALQKEAEQQEVLQELHQ